MNQMKTHFSEQIKPFRQCALSLHLLLGFILLTLVGCRHTMPIQMETPEAPPIKVGYFVGNGSRGGGIFLLSQILSHSPQVELTLLDGADLRAGKLAGQQLFVVPGGSSALQYKDMQEEGAEAVRQFVAAGGSYFGVCAGFHCALNRDERIKLLPYTWYFGGDGLRATLMVELNEKAAARIQVPAGRYKVRYSRGPISKPCEQPGTGWAEELGHYRDEMPETKISFGGAPAMLYGEYGKGKVIATSFHPEFFPETHPIVLGCVYAVTGRKLTPVAIKKDADAIRVAYLSNGLPPKLWVENALALDNDAHIKFQLASAINKELLEKVDVVICPNKASGAYKSTLGNEQNAEPLKQFLEKGGKLLVTKEGLPFAPKHENVLTIPGNAAGIVLCNMVHKTENTNAICP